MVIKVLVLCQRKYGTKGFNKKDIEEIDKDIEFLRKFEGYDHIEDIDDIEDIEDIIDIDYLTKGFDDKEDVMSFNIDFDYRNRETIDFVMNHMDDNHNYHYIIIGGCPHYIFNEQNIRLLSEILKKNGKIIFSKSYMKNFDNWYKMVEKDFLSSFHKISDDPKIILQKKRKMLKRKLGSLSNKSDEVIILSFRSKTKKSKKTRKSIRKSKKTRKSIRKSKKTRKSIRKSKKTRKSIRKSKKS
jgi:hypothetical protein